SGAAALILSRCTLTTAQLRSNILNNVDVLASLNGAVSTSGRLNVHKALLACLPPDFNISAAPDSRTVTAGAPTTYTATVSGFGGFTGTVTLSVTGLPAGVTASFAPPSIGGGAGSATLTVTTSGTTTPGAYSLTITGSSGSLSHSAPVTMIVQPPPTVG